MRNHFLAVLVVSGALLSGCTNPEPTDSQVLQLETTGIELTETTTEEETGAQPMMAETEKTLADFETIEATSVTLTTTKGDITFEIYTDKVPLTAQNFLNLSKEGFYDGIVFHRVIEDFMAQAGDPLSKDPSKQAMWGTGGPGYVIADEFVPELKHDSPGVLSMANKGFPKTGGSQFFITFEPTPWLDGKHTVFGKVTDGLDVLMNITQGDSITSVSFK